MQRFPTRQVHLDFHTSQAIPAVGAKFDRKQWQKAIRLGRLNSITIFAKCHHSWSYYPTKVGRRHPTLKRDLMGEQIEACHAIGVRAPLYYTAGWSANDAEAHPDWCVRDRQGKIVTISHDLSAKPTDPKPPFAWKFLCPTGDYRQLMLEQTAEICRQYPVDGLFYDICNCEWHSCFCPRCRRAMKDAGLDEKCDADARTHRIATWRSFMQASKAIVHGAHPQATVFWNGNAALNTPDDILALPTHFELEDLPTVWGGYDKFPPRAKWFARTGKAMLAMTGKFHTAWGEFGGFKHPDALRFEAASMIAFGAACSVGDQLHPSGQMDLGTYGNIGQAYKYVEAIEDFGGPGSLPFANLAVWISDGGADDEGLIHMLLERQMDFEVIRDGATLAKYAAVILPGGATLNATAIGQLKSYLQAGGAVLAIGKSIVDSHTGRLLLDAGGRYAGPGKYDCDYLQVGREIGEGLVASPFLNYSPALRVLPTGGKVLAKIYEPYFSRTYAHFCSHQNTPNQLAPAKHAGAIQKGRLVYLPHAMGSMYLANGARVHRDLTINALRRIYRKPTLQAPMPSAGRVSLLHQPDRNRYVLHLLYGTPLQRGKCSVIEDLPPIHDIAVTLRLPETVKKAWMPQGDKLRISRTAGGLKFAVPTVECHAMVVVEY